MTEFTSTLKSDIIDACKRDDIIDGFSGDDGEDTIDGGVISRFQIWYFSIRESEN